MKNIEKKIIKLSTETYETWKKMVEINLKMNKAYEWVKNKKTKETLTTEENKETYINAALKVNYLLLRSTDGEDNEIVRNQDSEDISTAYYKLVEKYEGNKDEILLRNF